MTLAKLCEEYQVELCLFDGSNWHSSGFYNPDINVLAIDHNLAPEQQIQVALHELGHKDHTRSEYQNARLRCENEYDPSPRHCWFSSFNYRYCGFNFCYPSSKIKKSPH